MQWFKNAIVYSLVDAFDIDESIIKNLDVMSRFQPCASQQSVSMGFIPPMINSEQIYHQSGSSYLFCIQIQERILPGFVVNEKVQDRIDQILDLENRKVGSKERATIKDQVIFQLLPQCFTKTTPHYFYIDVDHHILVVNAGSEKVADTLTSFTRLCIQSLPLVLFEAKVDPTTLLTHWVTHGESEPGWLLLGSAELIRVGTDAKVNLRNIELVPENIDNHLLENNVVSRVAIEWRERLTATINTKGHIKGIKFSDVITEQVFNEPDEALEQIHAATFLILSQTLNELIAEMKQLFGRKQETTDNE